MMGSELTSRAHRREARIALGMLPVGATITIVSVIAFGAVVLLALAAPIRGGPWLWTMLWALAAAAAAVRNILAGIAIMAAFDWRPVPGVLLWSGVVVAGWPGWWLG
ncbi:hypothetical protein [Sphingomonas sp.]|jgi:hypothetical protein|uniref:hypothetical protein n=1 Tax=Sphingomonas sp. TaxID=28214 RepID=UPI002D7F4314|nr:hypothetical protein [Sphingomonas sp.]HEU0045941.1 hypothetical protein [Sphingomonas sp.]